MFAIYERLLWHILLIIRIFEKIIIYIMASRRLLKRDISYISGVLFSDTMMARLLISSIDQAAAEVLMTRILDMEESFLGRASHTDAKANKALVKEYYKKLKVDLQTEVASILEELDKLTKESE